MYALSSSPDDSAGGRELTCFNEQTSPPTPTPTTFVLTHPPPTIRALVYQQQPPAPANRQGQTPAPAPPREDLRVFIRLDADASARNHIGYAIRAYVASKIAIELS
ncbi:Endonuclease/exonuclease/phosphatase [Metarhizium brunneum]